MSRGLKSYANKRDRNEPVIVETLRKAELIVTLHDEPWDLCCTFRGMSRWAEVKAPKDLKDQSRQNEPKPFTAKQIKRLKTWPGKRVDVLVTPKQAIEFAETLKSDAGILGYYETCA